MASFLTDNEDLLFYVNEGIDWTALAEVTEFGWRSPEGFKNGNDAKQFYGEIATAFGELAAEEFGTRGPLIDREGTHLVNGEAVESPSMKAAFDTLAAADMHKICIPREFGGINAPLILYFLCGEMIARADVASMDHFSFHAGMAMAALAYSVTEGTTTFDMKSGLISKTRFADAIGEIARGEAWGCMDITEPNAGSDMAALGTRAKQDENGNWFINGQKIFITSGHGKYHFVIARTEDAKDPNDPFGGLAGLSMFWVKTYEDLPDGTRKRYVTIERLEEKLGLHGSVTAALAFENSPAELIGKRGEGFKYMLVLMNNARVGTGFAAIGLAQAAYNMAKAYAAERRSMGKTIDRHEMIADLLDEMRTDIEAMRALAVAGAFHEEMSRKLELIGKFAQTGGADEADKIRRELPKHRHLSRRLTPLLKYFATEKCVEIARRNMQIHGGVGYTKEYGAERLLRDSLVLPVYEGTSQIQSLMAMKDTLFGIVKKPQAFVQRLAQAQWRSLSSRDPLERRVAKLQVLSMSTQQYLLTRTAAGKLKTLTDIPVGQWGDALKDWDPKRDFALAMLHAERLTRILTDEAIAEILLDQAKAHPKRRDVLERWLARAELRSKALHEEITTTGERILASLANEGSNGERLAAE
jgi:alkylation response protein AidB-like acyl-CoA dehydrogenase